MLTEIEIYHIELLATDRQCKSPLINIRYIWWHHGRCAHFTGLVHKTWKLCPLMGQVIHLVLFESVHSITRYGSKSKCPKSAPSSKIIFNGAALFCEIATQVCNIAKKRKWLFKNPATSTVPRLQRIGIGELVRIELVTGATPGPFC